MGIFALVANEMRVVTDPVAYAQRTITNSQNIVQKALFSPDNDIKSVIIGLIKGTKKRISVAAFTMTDIDIAHALIEKQREGVIVEVIADLRCSETIWSKITLLKNADMTVYTCPKKKPQNKFPDDNNKICNRDDKFSFGPIMHHKFMIFEDVFGKTILLTGSLNYTWSAVHINQENVIILEDKTLIQAYKNQFTALKGRSDHVSGVSRTDPAQAINNVEFWWKKLKTIILPAPLLRSQE